MWQSLEHYTETQKCSSGSGLSCVLASASPTPCRVGMNICSAPGRRTVPSRLLFWWEFRPCQGGRPGTSSQFRTVSVSWVDVPKNRDSSTRRLRSWRLRQISPFVSPTPDLWTTDSTKLHVLALKLSPSTLHSFSLKLSVGRVWTSDLNC